MTPAASANPVSPPPGAPEGDAAGPPEALDGAERRRRHLRASLVTAPLVIFALAVLGYTVYLGANLALVVMLAPGLLTFAALIYLKTYHLDLSEGPAYAEEYGGADAPETVAWGTTDAADRAAPGPEVTWEDRGP